MRVRGRMVRKVNRRAVGERFEEIACGYMEERGFRVLERNFRCRQGERSISLASMRGIWCLWR